MTVNQLAQALGAEILALPEGDKTLRGCYTGDLLSWVMGKARAGNVWITIMSNINVPAVASLADVSCVIIAESARPDDSVIAVSQARGVNLLLMPDSSYDVCLKVSKLI